jgi:hypothetical protein
MKKQADQAEDINSKQPIAALPCMEEQQASIDVCLV